MTERDLTHDMSIGNVRLLGRAAATMTEALDRVPKELRAPAIVFLFLSLTRTYKFSIPEILTVANNYLERNLQGMEASSQLEGATRYLMNEI